MCGPILHHLAFISLMDEWSNCMLYMQPVYFNESFFFSNYFEISYLSLYRRKKVRILLFYNLIALRFINLSNSNI